MTKTNPKGFSKKEQDYMTQALALSVKNLGCVWPNPSVGCVLVKNNEIIGIGYTFKGGRPHAEAVALEGVGENARGSTAYVTLEPCAHEDNTPSCARLLAEAGVKRVVYAVADPDPRTSGKGAKYLKKQGVEVSEGLCRDEAERLHQGFFLSLKENRPMVTLKLAISDDGKISEAEGIRTQITGEEAWLFTQKLRAKYDAILVGIGTVLADDPSLTCRIDDLEDRSPVRIILDRALEIPKKSALVKGSNKVPLWIVTEAETVPFFLTRKGIEIIQVSDIRNIKEVIEKIKEKGITRLFVEGGSSVATSFMKSGFVDHVYILKNPELKLGSEGVPAFREPEIFQDGKFPGMVRSQSNTLGNGIIEVFSKKV